MKTLSDFFSHEIEQKIILSWLNVSTTYDKNFRIFLKFGNFTLFTFFTKERKKGKVIKINFM